LCGETLIPVNAWSSTLKSVYCDASVVLRRLGCEIVGVDCGIITVNLYVWVCTWCSVFSLSEKQMHAVVLVLRLLGDLLINSLLYVYVLM